MAEIKKENWFKRTGSKVAKNALVVVACVVVFGVFIWLFDFVAQTGITALINMF